MALVASDLSFFSHPTWGVGPLAARESWNEQAVPCLDGARDWTPSWSFEDSRSSWDPRSPGGQAGQHSLLAHRTPSGNSISSSLRSGKRSFSVRPIGSCRTAAVALPPSSNLWDYAQECSTDVSDWEAAIESPLAEKDVSLVSPTSDLWSWGDVFALGEPSSGTCQRKSRKTTHAPHEDSTSLFNVPDLWDQVAPSADDLPDSLDEEEEFSFPVLVSPSELDGDRRLRRSNSFSDWAEEGGVSCEASGIVPWGPVFSFPDLTSSSWTSCSFPSTFILTVSA